MKMDGCLQRCHQALLSATHWLSRPSYVSFLLALGLSLLAYPFLCTVALQLHSAITGSYISGTHSLALVNCPNEDIARDIARAIMERRLAASVNILPKASTMYVWNGNTEQAMEILLLVKTKTSKIKELSDYVRSIHPFEIPELISTLIDHGNPAYLQWMEESVP